MGEIGPCYVVLAGLQLTAILLCSSKCWGYNYEYVFFLFSLWCWGLNPARSSCMPGKHSINRSTSSAEPVILLSQAAQSAGIPNMEHCVLCSFILLCIYPLVATSPAQGLTSWTSMLLLCAFPQLPHVHALGLRFVILLLQVPKCWDYSSAIFFPLLVSLHSPGWSLMHAPSIFAWASRHTWSLGNNFLLSM